MYVLYCGMHVESWVILVSITDIVRDSCSVQSRRTVTQEQRLPWVAGWGSTVSTHVFRLQPSPVGAAMHPLS
jgi:hypothetical protein